jgi:hypothetical protein
MAEKIKKHKDLVFIFGIGLVLAIGAILAMSGMVPLPNTVSAATTVQQSVGVTATVNEWLTFTISTSSVTLTPDLVTTAGATNIASSSVIDLNLGTNSADGWSISATGTNNGLLSGSNTIATPAAGNTTTTAAGTDAYGIQAATTSATGVNIATMYKVSSDFTSNVVGSIRTASQIFATSTAQFADNTNVIDMKVKASCDALQPSGSYTDTVYLTAIATP